MIHRNATQHDIAQRAQVSRSTVAAVLRNDARVTFSETTRRRVLEVAKSLNYQPHSAARSLRGGRTHTVALAISQFASIGGAIQSQNLRGMGEAAQQMGYSLTICSYGTVREMRSALDNLMRQSRFDGIVLHGDERDPEDPREAIVKTLGLPCVVLERRSDLTPWIDFDHYAGASLATRHLVGLGRRRIGLVGDWHPQRRAGYVDALLQAGLSPQGRLICPRRSAEPYPQAAQRAVESLFDGAAERPDALLCLSDEMAAAAIIALAERGLRVPDDVAVVGYDDSTLAGYMHPPLTSVRQDGVEMGRQAMRMLVRQIEEPEALVQSVVLSPSLTVRRSCGASSSHDPLSGARP